MINRVVIGLGFGDEGKGRVVDAVALDMLKIFSPEHLLNVRFNGGQQAGHTTFIGGVPRIHSNFGSAIRRGIPSYWGPRCTIYPVAIMNEYNSLVKEGYTPRLFIDCRCPITTPFEIQANRGDQSNITHGTCGLGFGKTIEREEKFLNVVAEHISHPSILKIKMGILDRYYSPTRNTLPIQGWAGGPAFERFWEAVDFINSCPNIEIVDSFMHAKMKLSQINGVIWEGAQGIMLDQNAGFFPHVTRSNTNLTNVFELVNNPITVDLVTRCYVTRHGNGPVPNKIPVNLINTEAEINVKNQYQGEFKKYAFDKNCFKYAIKNVMHRNYKSIYEQYIDGFNLHVTCLDQINGSIPIVDEKGTTEYDQLGFISALDDCGDFEKIYHYYSPENTVENANSR